MTPHHSAQDGLREREGMSTPIVFSLPRSKSIEFGDFLDVGIDRYEAGLEGGFRWGFPWFGLSVMFYGRSLSVGLRVGR